MGGKGAHLAEMAAAGLPVLPSFIISTEACHLFFSSAFRNILSIEMIEALRDLEVLLGTGFGDAERPLSMSVRSGAQISMPGIMDTVVTARDRWRESRSSTCLRKLIHACLNHQRPLSADSYRASHD